MLITAGLVTTYTGFNMVPETQDTLSDTIGKSVPNTPASASTYAPETNMTQARAPPLYIMDKAPFLYGRYTVYLTWRTGKIADRQNLSKNLLENFELYLNQSGIAGEIIPEVLNNVSNIAADSKLTGKSFDPDKDKFRADIFYNKLRLKKLKGDTYVLTLPWLDAREIDLCSQGVLRSADRCINGTRAIEFVPAEDMSNLISIDDASEYVLKTFDNGYSLAVQNEIVNTRIRNAAILVRGSTVSRSSGLRYMVLGSNDRAVNRVLMGISDAGGVISSFDDPTRVLNPQPDPSPTIPIAPPTPGYTPSPPETAPIPPIPEQSTVILTSAGLLGILLVSRKYRGN